MLLRKWRMRRRAAKQAYTPARGRQLDWFIKDNLEKTGKVAQNHWLISQARQARQYFRF